ncbi:hypothetical protein [Thalassotalea sediminis]|uniref:hypothetical protein n=1 Tax=Thalassotalea sediminis TaxID=1759089 RepID=UPI0025731283|nr:hypothetical protein [Thalassotalea sediminis]
MTIFSRGVFVPLFLSLFCQQGIDNRLRYSVIILVSHLFYLLFSAMFHQFMSIKLLIALFVTVVIFFASKRRLADAQLHGPWLYVPALSFLLSALLMVFVDVIALYWLILLPLFLASLLLTYPSKGNKRRHQYILGYSGPIDLSQFVNKEIHQTKTRVEPNLGPSEQPLLSDDELLTNHHQQQQFAHQYSSTSSTSDLGEHIRAKLLGHNSKYTLAAVIAIVITGIVITSLLTTDKPIDITQSNENDHAKALNKPNLERLHPLTMPDDFTLSLSIYDGIFISWQADITNENKVWDITTVQGDKSCELLVFNNDKSYRVMQVNVENQDTYIAAFTPLDSAEILNNIVYRGSFKLCGYDFSLKGTQALIGKNKHYAKLLPSS